MTRRAGCPICGRPRPSAGGVGPFCSQGCRDRDLLQWLDEGYRLPAHPADPAGDVAGLDSPADPD